MKITETLPLDYYEGRWDLVLETKNGREYIEIGRGEPEDMCLARDLSDVLRIKDLLIMAYNAGKNGEELITESFLEKDDE